ncbi:SDR family oxidoreductase [Metabacillus litoralis]|uniref:SDR family oxidoreductase n=1 Tax=Metabacillus litoralis TaxID=152268 RepID=UPI00203D4527|nr:SDR family oxidoreductase [Metabacillus litoralis]MCM3655318.1 SDR family oxidoreductase [Metabacillus litoralis]
MDISQQTALVTGANRGLGRQLALELISRGAIVYGGARNPDSIQLPGAKPLQIDITDPNSVAAAAEVAGDVTLLINNAGVSTGASLINGSLEDIHTEFDTHFFGTLSMVRAFAPKIASNGGGTILNILSALSWFSSVNAGAYSAAKSAEWALTNAIRLELADQKVRVAGLHVGYMDTDLTAGITAPKLNAADVAKIAIDGIQADSYEILADEVSQKVQKGLAGGVSALYPQFT